MLTLALAALLVLALGPVLASGADGSEQTISNVPVPVKWSRSGDAADAVEVECEGNFDLGQVYTKPEVHMLSTWSLLNAINANISGYDIYGNDLVWDGANQNFHYTDTHLNGTYTSYPTATINGEGTVRFQGTFDLNDILAGAPAGSEISNMKIGVSPYATSNNQVALNDQMFVFLYPADAELNDDNFMDYYVFGAGFEWLNQWLGSDGIFGAPDTFNDQPMIHTFRDFAYYGGSFEEERAAYEAFGYELEELGYPGWDPETGWFGHGLTYLLEQDKAAGNFTGMDQLYISDGLFFNNLDSQLVVDLNSYGGSLPTKWVIDIFAVNTDAVGGISQLQVFANYDEKTFGSTGSLVIGKEMGDKFSMKDSITGGYSYEAVPTIAKNGKETWDTSVWKHSLGGILKENNTWFQYNEFSNGTGGTFDLVSGAKLGKVGEYTVTSDGSGWFTFTMSDALYAVTPKVSISNTILAAKNTNDKNYNANNIWTTSPGQQQFSGSKLSGDGHSFSVYAPWVDTSKTVFVYIHLDGLTGYKNTNGKGPGDTFTVNVKGPSYPDGTDINVPLNGSINLTGLIPGEYVIRESENGCIPTFFVSGKEVKTGGTIRVTVEPDKASSVKLKNSPGEDPVSSEIVFKKLAETSDGYALGGGFTFNVYTEVYDGNPVEGSFVTSITTDSNGIGSFIADGYGVGALFYLFEEMNDAQRALYAPQSSCFEIRSAAVGYTAYVGSNVIVNSLLPGGFTVEKLIVQSDGTFVNAGEGFTFTAYAAIDESGNPAGDAIQTVTTGSDGLAVFGNGFKSGREYYVFEAMTENQKLLYVAENDCIVVTATTDGAAAGSFGFRNNLAFGSLVVTADLQGTHFIEYYVPGGYLTFKTSGTLVTWVGYGDHTDPLIERDGFTGYFATVGNGNDAGNGFTYLEINLAALEAIEGGTFMGIAQSDQKSGPLINNQFNLDIHHDYHMEVADGKLIVTCDVLTGGFGIALSGAKFAGNPNQYTQGHPYNINNPFVIPVANLSLDDEGNFYFFFHIESGSTMYVTPLQASSWNLDRTEQVFDEYTGGYNVDVFDADGVSVCSGPLGAVGSLGAGMYTVVITAGGEEIGSQSVTVEAGKTVTLDFGTVFIFGPTEEAHLS